MTVAIKSKQPAWVSPVGIELTFMLPSVAHRHKRLKEVYDRNVHEGTDKFVAVFRKELIKEKVLFYNCGMDCGGVVEVSSKILSDFQVAEQWYEAVITRAKAHGCETMDRFYATGGGHIHFDAFNQTHLLKITKDMQLRPYLNWLFNDINDIYNANHFTWGYLQNKNSYGLKAFKGIGYRVSKDIAVRKCGYSLPGAPIHSEMRIFRAPNDWEEQKLHLYFLQAYLAWVDKQPDKKMKLLKFEGREKVFTKDYCIKGFRKLLSDIGLEFSDYEMFIPNLEDRISFGPEWMI